MEEIYQKLSLSDLWKITKPGNETSFDVTEVWLNHASGKINIEQFRVTAASFPSWLETETRQTSSAEQSSLLQRIAWLDIDVNERQIKLAKLIRNKLVDKFGLGLASSYFSTYVTGITSLPTSSDAVGERRSFALSHAPKLAALWCQQRFSCEIQRPPITRAVIYMPEEAKKRARDFLNLTWHESLYHNAMFPAFLMAIQLEFETDKVQEVIKTSIREIEQRTGYHQFASKADKLALGDLGPLAASASGYAAKLASVERKSKAVSKILEFMRRSIQESRAQYRASVDATSYDLPWAAAIEKSNALLDHHITVLNDRLQMQMVDTDYTLTRVKIQIEALFSLITQNDSLNSLQQAQSNLAIAEASYRDSSSMKTLAIVTMFFLPGSFISAIFSMPMFDWSDIDKSSTSIGVGLMPQFSLYWVITVPLTVATFALYFLWLRAQKKEFVRKIESVRRHKMDDYGKEPEVESQRLEQKRREASI